MLNCGGFVANAQPFGKPLGLAVFIDAGHGRVACADDLIITSNFVLVSDADTFGFFQSSLDGEQIVKFGSRLIVTFGVNDNQHHAAFFHFPIRMAPSPQHFGACDFKIVQIVGMVDMSLSVGFLVPDAKFQRMNEGRLR